MKLDKFTKVFLNLVLVLLIALFLKFLITAPKDVYAKGGVEYKTTTLGTEMKEQREELYKKLEEYRGEGWQQDYFIQEILLNQYAKKGWRLHSFIPLKREGDAILIFER